MGMVSKGHIELFNPKVGNWESYLDRFECFLITNSIEGNDVLHTTFLSNWGQAVFNIARDLVAPFKVLETSLSIIKTRLTERQHQVGAAVTKRTHKLALKKALQVEPPIFLYANCDQAFRATRHAVLTLCTMAIPLTPLMSKTTNQNCLMMVSTEREPTIGRAALKKAHEGEYVLVAVVCMATETVNSAMLSVVFVER
ncbi:UNVERIFIED_CONTAM: hypothetical protein K2H54_028165 [Gekko kuhli]